MNGRNVPPSPISVGGNEWPGTAKHNGLDDGLYNTGTAGGMPRAQPISPPNSSGPGGLTNGFPMGSRTGGGPGAGAPSPPPSIGRSSLGTTIYARTDAGRSVRDTDQLESLLSEHYVLLSTYLDDGAYQGDATVKPTNASKAQDKLLRLSVTQFLELSTDVYDELVRRRSSAQQPPNGKPSQGPPSFLPPEPGFHPKRNQARQKLASLGAPRFRELSADVFGELSRRFPRFATGEVGRPGEVSRAPTPTLGPRSASRGRNRSDDSGRGAGGMASQPAYDAFGMPPSPRLDVSRPTPKQFQSNVIVPSKSTMVEEYDDDDDPNFGPKGANGVKARRTERSAAGSDADRRLLDDYQNQIRELRDKLERTEDGLRRKEEEIKKMVETDRSRATAAGLSKKEWTDMRLRLESRVAESEDLNESLRQEMARQRNEHASDMRELREKRDKAGKALAKGGPGSSKSSKGGSVDLDLRRENDELRKALSEQEVVIKEVRREAGDHLREMRLLSQQSGSTWRKHGELGETIAKLEAEVDMWRNRYAHAKSMMRTLRAGSIGVAVEDASQYVRQKGFVAADGLVKDLYVTKFQMAIDGLLQRGRKGDPELVLEAMKEVVSAVRQMTQDADERERARATAGGGGRAEEQDGRTRLRSKISAAANSLITASKNFAASGGISPVGLLDAAASALAAAVVDFLRSAKIRPTEEGDDDGNEGTGQFGAEYRGNDRIQANNNNGSNSNNNMYNYQTITANRSNSNGKDRPYYGQADGAPGPTTRKGAAAGPPPFQGMGALRTSAFSSTYSPLNSPRESAEAFGPIAGVVGGGRGGGGGGPALGRSNTQSSTEQSRIRRLQDLKIYLEDQNAVLVSDIQNLVGSIRSEGNLQQLSGQIDAIANVVGRVTSETQARGYGDMATRMTEGRQRLLEAGDQGAVLAGKGLGAASREWRMWTATLPPIAFEIARETKALVQRVEQLVLSGDGRA